MAIDISQNPSRLNAVLRASIPFTVACGSSMVATVCIQPIDTVKVRMQLMGQGQSGGKTSPFAVVQNIVAGRGGFFNLYQGLSAGLLRQLVYGTARLGLFSTFEKKLTERARERNTTLGFGGRALAGLGAGALAAFIGNPTEVALVRMQADTMKPPELRRNYTSAFNALGRITREEGVFGLWKGASPTVIRAMSTNFGQLAFFSESKHQIEKHFGSAVSPQLRTACAAFIAGLSGAILSLPFDFVKTRLQNQSMAASKGDLPLYKGTFDCFAKVLRSEGPMQFYLGPRDGLQNIKQKIPTDTKIELIRRLADTGLQTVEATSFVSPEWVPQLADGAAVMASVLPLSTAQRPLGLPVLAPNLKGLENAHKAGAKEIVVFASITEPFSKANQNCTVSEALEELEKVTRKATELGIRVRAATSCIFSDPFAGPTPPEAVLPVVQRMLNVGCYEVALGDTLGVGTPMDVQRLLEVLLPHIPASKLAGHFHDTYGQGIGNVVKSYEMGLRTFDSSVAGLGGCPYAPGARGNISTEDIVYTLEKGGIRTGVDLDKLIEVGQWVSKEIGIPYGSRVGAALAAKKQWQGTSLKDGAKSKPAQPAQEAKTSRTWKVIEDTGEYRVSQSGTTVKVTLTRPRNGNALTDSMLQGLTDFFRTVGDRPDIYQIVLEAEGKYFCTGMDLSGNTDTADASTEDNYYAKVFALYDAIDHVPQTTISLVDGPCFGGGVGLTFVCDVRIVSDKARWTLSEAKIGVSPAVISKFLVREWGPSTAREGMISAREIRPAELHRIGAIHHVVPESASLDECLNKYLDQLDRVAPRAVAINKELTRLAWDTPDSPEQVRLVKKTFNNMMAPGSEGEHGIGQFQKKQKTFSWRQFWAERVPYSGVTEY
ncbi:hypothetical protein SBRCBS47491_007457 [Sporothrix bragantina]|uniref:hydroxymethylglutaryl-CoA lyase n=1 Tax=Sporothrix bragantina TaxID=671064 RepID=A0ABP0CF66_9PEZI